MTSETPVPLLQIEDLHVSVGDREILRGVDLTIQEGETPGATLVDIVESGLAFVDCGSVTRSSTALTTSWGAGDFSDMCNDGSAALSAFGRSFDISISRRFSPGILPSGFASGLIKSGDGEVSALVAGKLLAPALFCSLSLGLGLGPPRARSSLGSGGASPVASSRPS